MRKLNLLLIGFVLLLLTSCGRMPIKKYYVLKYEPDNIINRISSTPYPFTIRVKDFDIEKVYENSRIVYSTSAYELQYYYYRLWAVKPAKMFTDVLSKHVSKLNLVNNVTRRLDEGSRPDFEISGRIEAIEEFNTDDEWFGHIALRLSLSRVSNGEILYQKNFDKRKRVAKHSPEYVVRTLSELTDFIISEAISDIDPILNDEMLKVNGKLENEENIDG